ncbi:hypothetical protein COO60DRAFT_1552496 [Scenedesmus sp. NREL 46B-D3]|nr:hypothetical protein COO60DRAFT_1552496 [Scenedesmus sp. NREL 46B-D3]
MQHMGRHELDSSGLAACSVLQCKYGPCPHDANPACAVQTVAGCQPTPGNRTYMWREARVAGCTPPGDACCRLDCCRCASLHFFCCVRLVRRTGAEGRLHARSQWQHCSCTRLNDDGAVHSKSTHVHALQHEVCMMQEQQRESWWEACQGAGQGVQGKRQGTTQDASMVVAACTPQARRHGSNHHTTAISEYGRQAKGADAPPTTANVTAPSHLHPSPVMHSISTTHACARGGHQHLHAVLHETGQPPSLCSFCSCVHFSGLFKSLQAACTRGPSMEPFGMRCRPTSASSGNHHQPTRTDKHSLTQGLT